MRTRIATVTEADSDALVVRHPWLDGLGMPNWLGTVDPWIERVCMWSSGLRVAAGMSTVEKVMDARGMEGAEMDALDFAAGCAVYDGDYLRVEVPDEATAAPPHEPPCALSPTEPVPR